MNELLEFVLDKHGGIDRWNDAKVIAAHIYIQTAMHERASILLDVTDVALA